MASTGAYGRRSANPGGAMRKPSAALVVATAALVMSTLGTSLAATHYVITSPKQVKPGTITLSALTKQARKALRGERGPRGQAGASGAAGPGRRRRHPRPLGDQAVGADRFRCSVNVSTPGVTARLGVSPGTYAVNSEWTSHAAPPLQRRDRFRRSRRRPRPRRASRAPRSCSCKARARSSRRASRP